MQCAEEQLACRRIYSSYENWGCVLWVFPWMAEVAAAATGSIVSASLAMGLIRMMDAHRVAGRPCKGEVYS